MLREISILAQNWSQIAEQKKTVKISSNILLCILGECPSLWLMALFRCDRWHVTLHMWHVILVIWHLTPNEKKWICCVLVLISAHIERFSIFPMFFFYLNILFSSLNNTLMWFYSVSFLDFFFFCHYFMGYYKTEIVAKEKVQKKNYPGRLNTIGGFEALLLLIIHSLVFNAVQYCAVQCSAVQFSAVQCYVAQFSAVTV